MPKLTVKAAAELLNLPAYAQTRVLADQKYPRQGPQVFKTPYYQQALSGIRNYFLMGNNKKALNNALSKIESIGQESRKQHNKRVIESFCGNDLYSREFELQKNKRHIATIGTVEFKLTPDLQVLEKDEPRVILLHLKAQKLESELARTTLELAHWVYEQEGHVMSMSQMEYVDLFSNVTHVFKSRRPSTIKNTISNVHVIEAIWESL